MFLIVDIQPEVSFDQRQHFAACEGGHRDIPARSVRMVLHRKSYNFPA